MADEIEGLLDVDEADLAERWDRVASFIRDRFSHDVSIEAVLFLIGVQSRGRGFEPSLEKEAKQDVIMEGTYCAFETLGLYHRIGLDEEGSWIWERTVESIPKLSVEKQEKLLRLGIVRYFDDVFEGTTGAAGDEPPMR